MKRLQFEMPEERVEELDALADRIGLKTRVQLFNAALTLFEWTVKERESGRIIASMDEATGNYKELEMPGLPRLTRMPPRDNIEEFLRDANAALGTALASEAELEAFVHLGELQEKLRVLREANAGAPASPEDTRLSQEIKKVRAWIEAYLAHLKDLEEEKSMEGAAARQAELEQQLAALRTPQELNKATIQRSTND